MIGYKGFDKNFKCKDFQYEVGQTYHYDGDLKICERGYHFCDTPLAVFAFYSPADSRFALVEATGTIVKDDVTVHKFCTDELKIIKELTLNELIAAVPTEDTATNTNNCSAASVTGDYSAASVTGDYSAATSTGYCSAATNTGYRSVATNTGDCSAATNTGGCSAATNTGDWSVASVTGDYSAATNTGDCSAATNTGGCSAASVTGKKSVAVVTGRKSKAKGAVDCWLVLSEWINNTLADVKAFKVDGETIKADTFYMLKDGQAVAVEEEK